MFDGNWRDAVDDEPANPSLPFIACARVRHQHFGIGRIESMELRDSTRVMSIEFVTCGRRTVTVNLQTIIVIDEESDESEPSWNDECPAWWKYFSEILLSFCQSNGFFVAMK